MNPFFFGPSEGSLFGLYHPASNQPARPTGVVVCNPFGDEAIKAHRALQGLARMLADERFHVLRFDYFATGDSAGDGREGTLEHWQNDIGIAIDELKDTAGVRKVSLVGLRLGASLALSAAHKRRDIDRVVVWDPILDGKLYLDQLRAAHAAYVATEFDSYGPDAPMSDDEIMGFALTPAIQSAIEKIRVDTFDILPAKRAGIVASSHHASYQQLAAHLEKLGVTVAHEHVPVGVNWNADEAMESSLVPKEALVAIVNALSSISGSPS